MSLFYLTIRSFLFLVLFTLISCDEEPEPVNISQGNIFTEKGKLYFPGDIVILEGLFKDLEGLKSIKLFSIELKVDKEFIMNGEITYDLNYAFRLPEDLFPLEYEVLITVTNENDQYTEFYYIVDFAVLPKADNLKMYYKGVVGQEIKIMGKLIDPQGLSRFYFYSLNLDLYVTIDFPDKTFEHILKQTFVIPEGSQLGIHRTTVILVNKRGLHVYILDLSIEVLAMESGN